MHLRVTTSVHYSGVLDCGDKYTQGIMKTPLHFIEDVSSSSPQDDGAGFVLLATRELDHLVLPNHDLFDASTEALNLILPFGSIKGRQYFCTGGCCDPLHTLEISMLDHHNT